MQRVRLPGQLGQDGPIARFGGVELALLVRGHRRPDPVAEFHAAQAAAAAPSLCAGAGECKTGGRIRRQGNGGGGGTRTLDLGIMSPAL